MSDYVLVSCCSFVSISSDNGGIILNINESKKTEVVFSSFSCIFSSSYPGCFYTLKGQIKIASCMFFNCSGSGIDCSFGNIGWFSSCATCLDHINSMLCSFTQTGRCDSLVVINSANLKTRVMNSSYCLSSNGSPTIRAQSIKSLGIKFINCISCVDYC